jgi:hypothetical protein
MASVGAEEEGGGSVSDGGAGAPSTKEVTVATP